MEEASAKGGDDIPTRGHRESLLPGGGFLSVSPGAVAVAAEGDLISPPTLGCIENSQGGSSATICQTIGYRQLLIPIHTPRLITTMPI
ncbi:MAG: hypothetical protein NZ602_17440 [Thermoguttaceae bacterium]|nr:hypothetical protein [Thermoguttaceae bacterium]MDW8036987.1 hypothetical protein [Thermoguttaceae bacterium]